MTDGTKRRSARFTMLGLSGAILVYGFVNCDQSFRMSFSSRSAASIDLPILHPQDDKVTVAQAAPPLANRIYVASIFREVFSDPQAKQSYSDNLDFQIRSWAVNQGPQLGQGCNVYSSATSVDCGGDVANSNLPLTGNPTIVREALRIHLCEEILGDDRSVAAALAKIGLTPNGAPSADAISATTALFYRGDRPSQDFINELASIDADVDGDTTVPHTTVDRWRLILLQLCEAPDWQLL